jgi:hypothetical protein
MVLCLSIILWTGKSSGFKHLLSIGNSFSCDNIGRGGSILGQNCVTLYMDDCLDYRLDSRGIVDCFMAAAREIFSSQSVYPGTRTSLFSFSLSTGTNFFGDKAAGVWILTT